MKWWQQVLVGTYLPRAPGVRMTVVKLTPSNYLMNLFPRRSYFLLAISMGPTSLYPDKPSPKNDPFFWYL